MLVATPALIRDFSPQLGRASAMGFWTLGPVVGSLVVTEVSSNTLDAHPDWQYQFRICGIVGVVVFVIAFFGLRELAPKLRDQLMVSLRDRALIEARARGIDPEAALQKGHWRQMLRWDIIGPSFAVAVFLLFYYIAVGSVRGLLRHQLRLHRGQGQRTGQLVLECPSRSPSSSPACCRTG